MQSDGIRGNQRQSEAIRWDQRPSEAIRGNQRQSEANRWDQRPSEAIRGHQRPSARLLLPVQVAQDGAQRVQEACRAPARRVRKDADRHVIHPPHLRDALLVLRQLLVCQALLMREVIRGHQHPSGAIRGTIRGPSGGPSADIRGRVSPSRHQGHQRPSEAIRGHQRQSAAIRGRVSPSRQTPDRTR